MTHACTYVIHPYPCKVKGLGLTEDNMSTNGRHTQYHDMHKCSSAKGTTGKNPEASKAQQHVAVKKVWPTETRTHGSTAKPNA